MNEKLQLIYPVAHVAITDSFDFRNAALWFDHVVALNPHAFRQKFVTGFGSRSSLHIFDVASALAPPAFLENKEDGLCHFKAYVEEHIYAYNILMIEGRGDPEIEKYFNSAQEHLAAISPLILQYEPARLVDEPSSRDTTNRIVQEEQQVSLALMNLDLIDVTNVGWDQILEFREDASSRQQLRALRLMFYEDYAGKSIGFIQDHLAQRLHEYKQTANKWGFDLAKTVLAGLLESKTLLATTSATLTAAVFGGPLAALPVGISVELGQLALKVIEVKRSKREFESNHPLAYLISASDAFSNPLHPVLR